jgi:hypothetical protein
MDIPVFHSSYEAPVQRTPLVSATPVSAEKPPQVSPTLVPVEIPSQVPATLKLNLLTPPPTEEKRPKLQCNIFHNWVDSTDWRPHDLAIMTPEQREGYEQSLLRERPKYIPMKSEKIAKLSPEDRQEYENSLNTQKTPKRYALKLNVVNFVKHFEEINVF